MSDTYREVTRRSWLGRLGGSVGGVVIGLVLLAASIVLLFWNEGRAVTTARSLSEGGAAVVSLPPASVDPAYDGRLIHVSGPVTAEGELADPDFGVASPGLRLQRRVEMYQWKEESKSQTETKLGGGEETVTTYSYSRGWDDDAVDSSEFKQPQGHRNPPMEIQGREFAVSDAKLGAFSLGGPALERIDASDRLPLVPAQAETVRAVYGGTQRVAVLDGAIRLGRDPSAPQVGDYRITYSLAPLGPYSVVGRQTGSSFAPYQTEAGDALLMVEKGEVPASAMFASAEAGNTVLTWILRAVGLLLLLVAFSLLLAPIGVVADVVPVLGRLVRLGTGTLAIALTVLVGSVTVALAWIWFRPLLAVGLIAAGLAVAFLLTRFGRGKPAPAAA